MKRENPPTRLKFQIRKALNQDVKEMQKLINHFASEGLMLSRSLSELFDTLRDFHVCQGEEGILGVCALHVVWEDFAEIKSLAVAPPYQKQGIGKQMVRACLNEAVSLKIQHVFTLTYKPDFFQPFGFHVVEKDILPHKVWGECIKCVKFPDCNEVALIVDLGTETP
ncbi:MAG: N-acetyltransferase [bacterium]